MNINIALDKLEKDIQQLRSHLNIKECRVDYLKQKRKSIVAKNRCVVGADGDNIPHPQLIPTQPFKKNIDNIPNCQDQMNLGKILPMISGCPKSRLLIKIGSKHDSSYFLNH